MQYFTEGFNNFFKGLAPNNHKDWFHENKKTYEREVKKAFAKFLGDLIQNIREKYDPELDLEVKNAVFRINRDIRFSKDKTPYKLQVSAIVSRGGRKNMQYPGMYIQFGVGEIWLGGGMYRPEKENLQLIREHIVRNPEQVKKLKANKAFKAIYSEIQGDKNKRIPKDFKEAVLSESLIANKQFYFMAQYEDDESILLKEDLMDWVLQHYEAGMAWNQFFVEAMSVEQE
jgi:uncharacterized protein (TIGR02453 family)